MKIAMMLLTFILPQLWGQENDPRMLRRIRVEAFENSQITVPAWKIAKEFGPRMTGTPKYREAGEWIKMYLRNRDIKVWEEKWGEFGTTWEPKSSSLLATSPILAELPSIPYAWSPSAFLLAPVVYAPWTHVMEESKVDGALRDYFNTNRSFKDKIVAMDAPLPLWKPPVIAPVLTEKELTELALPPTTACGPFAFTKPWPSPTDPRYPCFIKSAPETVYDDIDEVGRRLRQRIFKSFKERGAVAVLRFTRSNGDIFFPTDSAARHPDHALPLPIVVTNQTSYGEVVGLIKSGKEVRVALDMKTEFHKADSFNLFAEIPGKRSDCVVMLGAHLDGAPRAQGTVDNGSGVIAAIESIRILKTLKVRPECTIRLALWDAEEWRLLGSRGYVEKHQQDLKTVKTLYINLDHGTGRIRGLYTEGQTAPTLAKLWLSTFRKIGSHHVALRDPSPGRSDYWSFREAGFPWMNFVLDPEGMYDVIHSTHDTYERLSKDNLKHNAMLAAWVIYQAANTPEKLPNR